MNSNSQNMNVSERLAQRLKESEIGAFLDEDDLTKICTDAIKKAFFENRRTKEGYHETVKEPFLVELARDHFKSEIQATINSLVDDLLNTQEFRMLIVEAVLKMIPMAANESAKNLINASVMASHTDIMANLRPILEQKLGVSVY